MQSNINEKFFSSIFKSAFTSLIVALVGILILAFVIKISSLSPNVVSLVVLFMKIISIFIGCFLSINGKNGFVKGALSGILFAVVAYLIFTLIGGEQIVFKGFLIDTLICFFVGAISGIVAVNTNK